MTRSCPEQLQHGRHTVERPAEEAVFSRPVDAESR
jgi:hypothetical protein